MIHGDILKDNAATSAIAEFLFVQGKANEVPWKNRIHVHSLIA